MSEESNIENNPYIPKPEDYFEGYNKSIAENFGTHQKEAMEQQKLTFLVFDNEEGRKWIKMMKEDFIRQFCMIDMTANNAGLCMANMHGSLLTLLQIEAAINAYKEFLKSE